VKAKERTSSDIVPYFIVILQHDVVGEGKKSSTLDTPFISVFAGPQHPAVGSV